jgi:hypothetical protein
MGDTSFSDTAYASASTFRSARGISDFSYHDSGAAAATGTVHDDLNLHGKIRESRDSAAHPLSKPVAVWIDVTGSMLDTPRLIFAELPTLFGLLVRKGYLPDAHVMFAAIGDWTSDKAPVQAGQFEAGNEVEDDLARFWLEGGGGGQKTESYELLLWYMAHRVDSDAREKRGEKGYLFIVGDEMARPQVDARAVGDLFGVTLEANIPLAEVVAAAREKWEIFFVLPAGTSYVGDSEVLDFWRGLLGQNVIELPLLETLCSTIALTVGLAEGVTSMGGGMNDLADEGISPGARRVIGTALATLASSAPSGTVVAAAPPGELDAPSGNTRL